MQAHQTAAVRRTARRSAATVAGLYLIFAVGWIVFSDGVVAALAESSSQGTLFQTIKGLVFVSLSALLIYALVAEAVRRAGLAHVARARSERRVAAVLEAVNDGLWEHDLITGRVIMAGRWSELTGHPAEAVDTLDAFEALVHPDDFAVGRDAYEACLEGRAALMEAEYRLRTAAGDWVWVRARGRVIDRAADGTPLLAMGTFTDLTAIREREHRLSALVDTLRRSEAEIERFAHATAHELRQPVRQMVSYAQLLAQRGGQVTPVQQAEYAGYMRDGAERLTRILDALLASFEHRAAATRFQRLDLDRVVRQVLEKLGGEIARSSTDVTLGQLPLVQGDALQLTLLFEHLIANALKFRSPSRAPTLRIDARREDGAWVIDVTDNGIGFPAEQGEHLFNAFTRLHPPNQFPGAGMGLALCLSIARNHGGTITADGRPGEGATFTVTLPVAEETVAEETGAEETGAADADGEEARSSG